MTGIDTMELSASKRPQEAILSEQGVSEMSDSMLLRMAGLNKELRYEMVLNSQPAMGFFEVTITRLQRKVSDAEAVLTEIVIDAMRGYQRYTDNNQYWKCVYWSHKELLRRVTDRYNQFYGR
jgi:hypothetical protein